MTDSASDEVLITHLNAKGQGHHEAVWRTWEEMVERAVESWLAPPVDLDVKDERVRARVRVALRAALTYSDEELQAFKDSR